MKIDNILICDQMGLDAMASRCKKEEWGWLLYQLSTGDQHFSLNSLIG